MALELDGRRKELCDWLTANHIDPSRVPFDADLTIDDAGNGRVIRVEVEVTDDADRLVLDAREHRAAVETRTVPLLVEPPAWWQPYEKPTRLTLLATVERVRKAVASLHADVTEARQMGYETSAAVIEGSALRISNALDGPEEQT